MSDVAPGLLVLALSVAVPIWICKFRKLPWSEVQRIAAESAETVAFKGDVILHRSTVKGETAKAFDALARGVATLAFAPGGVTLFGLRFEATHDGEKSISDPGG